MGHLLSVLARNHESGDSISCMTTLAICCGNSHFDDDISRKLMRKHCTSTRLDEVYTYERYVGSGSVGIVGIVRKRDTNALYAFKTLQLHRISPSVIREVYNEINILMEIDHPNIVRALDLFVQQQQIYLVLDLCDGGNLYTRLPYTEKQSALIVNQVCAAIRYLHDKGIVHRDIKFENIVFENRNKDSMVKLVDFGLSKISRGMRMHDTVGTLYSLAPEVLFGNYTEACDMWSLGVVAFMLMAGKMPFESIDDNLKMRCNIEMGNVHWEETLWQKKSYEARDFIQCLIRLSPCHRLTAHEALQHPWLLVEWEDYIQLHSPRDEMKSDVISSLQRYGRYNAIHKAAKMIIARRTESHKLQEMRDLFYEINDAHDGIINEQELGHFIVRKHDMAAADITKVFEGLDVSHSGQIGFTEFLAATLDTLGLSKGVDRLFEAFDQLDSDGSGKISQQNVEALLGSSYTKEEIKKMIEDADTTGDGTLDFNEFAKLIKHDMELSA